MAGSHHTPTRSEGLYLAGDSVIHRLPAHVKVVAAVLFVFCVVATPRTAPWAFAVYGGLLAVVAGLARIPLAFISKRALIETPLIVLALVLPFASGPPDTEVLGVPVSQDGLYAAFNLLAKGTLGITTSIILGATTPIRELLVGMQRLRLPRVVTEIATLMVRYLAVILDQGRRMRVARLSRGDDPRFLWQVGAYASSTGTLFVRSYERGERVYVAMAARGYSGQMPVLDGRITTAAEWTTALSLPILGAVVALAAWWSTLQ